MNWGIRILQTLALPLGYGAIHCYSIIPARSLEPAGEKSFPYLPRRPEARQGGGEQTGQRDGKIGASDEARTRYLHLGKVALYQMSYTRVWCPGPELNQRHADFQSAALPTELPGHRMWRRGWDLNPRPPA